MTKTLERSETDNTRYLAPAAFLFSGLMPEYIAPFFTVIGFILVLKNRINTKIKPKFGDLGISVLVYMAWMLISSFWTSSVVSSLASIGLWALMFSGYYFFTETVKSQEDIDRLFFCGAICAGVAGFIGIAQLGLFYISSAVSKYFNPFWRFIDFGVEKLIVYLPDFIKSNMGATKFPNWTDRAFGPATRSCGTFSNPLFFAAAEIMLFPFAAYVFLCSKEKKEKIIGFICLVLSMGGIASSYSRGPYLYSVLVFLILLFYGGKKSKTLFAFGSVAACSILVAASGIIKRFLTLLDFKEYSMNLRFDIYGAILDMIRNKPVMGYGTGFGNIRQMLHNVYNVKQPHAHNIFLEAWVEHGILGPVLLAAIFVVFVINIIKLIKCGQKQREIGITLLASVSGFLFCGITDCLFYGLKPLQYFMMILGISQAAFALYLHKKK